MAFNIIRKKGKYKRLPGRAFFVFAAKSLWQAQDHLLYVDASFFRENYKRFDYNDIQSIFVVRSDTRMIWSLVWGALATMFSLIVQATPGSPAISGMLLFTVILAFIANLLMGPGVTVYLKTAVQLQKLSCLRRLKTADKVLPRLKALIQERQGVWQKQMGMDAQTAIHESSVPASSVSQEAPSAKVKSGNAPIGPYKALLHQILFSLITALGMLGILQVFLKSLPLGLMESLLHGIVQIIVIAAHIRWYRHLKGTLIARLNWVALVFIAVLTIIGYGSYVAVSLSNPEMNYNYLAIFKELFELQMSDHPLAVVGNIVYTGGSLLLGVLGLLVLRRHKPVA